MQFSHEHAWTEAICSLGIHGSAPPKNSRAGQRGSPQPLGDPAAGEPGRTRDIRTVDGAAVRDAAGHAEPGDAQLRGSEAAQVSDRGVKVGADLSGVERTDQGPEVGSLAPAGAEEEVGRDRRLPLSCEALAEAQQLR